MHWVNDYIGLPWVAYARGPDKFDCWGLVLDVLSKQFQIDLPQYLTVKTDDPQGMTESMLMALQQDLVESVNQPNHGAIACCYIVVNGQELMRHVGIYLDIDGGGILHSYEKHTCAFDSPKKLHRLFHRIEYLCPRTSS